MLRHSRRAATAALCMISALVLGTAAACSSSGSGADDSPSRSDAGTDAAAKQTPSSGSTAPVASFPVTVQAANGAVTIETKPTAIVSLSPTGTEMLYAVGAGAQVKAVDSNSTYPTSAPRTKLSSYQLNVESLVKYRPDLVVTSGTSAAQLKKITSLGMPVLELPAATGLQQSYQQITQVGLVTGHPAKARALVANMKKQIAAIVAKTPKLHANYYWELDQTYYSETSATFIGKLLKLVGLTSIADAAKGAAASGGYPQLSAEFILTSNPDYIFLADTKCCKQSPKTVAKRPGWDTLAAVRNDRVIPLDDDIASRWGPRIVDLLRVVATAVDEHPAAA